MRRKFFLSGPVTEWVSQAPEISRKIQYKLAVLRSPVNAVVQASEQVGNIADSASATDVQKVVIQQPGMLSIAAASAFGGITTAGVTFVLLLFLLSSGTMFYQKIISILPTLTDKKRALTIAYDVEREVSQYLSTITLINCGFGAAVAGNDPHRNAKSGLVGRCRCIAELCSLHWCARRHRYGWYGCPHFL